ncbi:nuclear factor erythroid 2-related factor 2a isoform X1 [Stegostoma tigrinum]|uniref:nuclear factor erythroid 2-related factor 2a isoform X1 n=1 Tax=Stegostoma tigrinum TaxID=3053191 RepID=UPI00202B1BB4|nr:nuclear factor erythroid 2-related factor 2a isoform X1 [Stegostoma tigrinum]
MEIERSVAQQQNIDLIDILWRQDIDLGVVREDFDYNYRQKEYELEKQKKLEKEKQEQLQKEQEKALLAQLQLDEETGEFVAIRPAKHSEPEISGGITEPTQSVKITERDDGALSFDECMQLLAESFPFVNDIESRPVALEPPVPAQTSPQPMSPHQTQQGTTAILPSTAPESNPLEDLEQTWQELLSIPELQCLYMQNDDITSTGSTEYSSKSKSSEMQNDSCSLSTTLLADHVSGSNTSFLSLFDGPYEEVMPSESPTLFQPKTNLSDGMNLSFNNNHFSDLLFSTSLNMQRNSNISQGNNMNDSLTGILDDSLLEQINIAQLEVNKDFDCNQPQNLPEVLDSDSGLSMGSSPGGSSPGNSMQSSVCGDVSNGCSDSDTDDMESCSGSVQPEFGELYPVQFQSDCNYQASSLHSVTKSNARLNLYNKGPKDDLPVSPGHNKVPFTKDKHSKRSEARLSRDEQRAKALNVPFSVKKIVNLPVDDFNEMVSKYQLGEAQLALIRDIRRRGKNKVAAQNCRKRKLENILGLEQDLDLLKDEKEELLQEKGEHTKNLLQIKQQLNNLYHEVFSMLRDEDGNSYSPNEYSLQQTSDGSVFLVPRSKKLEIKRE